MEILQLIFLVVLLVVSYQDIKKMEIKDGCHAVIVLLAAAAMFLDRNPEIISRLLGALCVSVPMLALTLLFSGAFGGGDIKLLAAAGLFLGWEDTVIAAVLSVFAAGAYALYLLVIKRADRGCRFPFGPFLCAGMAAAILWGNVIRELWMNL